ncbi:hypothetical protein SUGI_0305500, partial [Cryptomeria japonica]
TIPPTISACRSLHYLDLSFNQLHGSIPPDLGLLTSLRILYLGANNLTAIPHSLGNLSALVNLDLAENDLTGPIPPELGMLTHLQMLQLFQNHLSGNIPSSLTNLSKLNRLDFFQNQLSGHIPWDIGTKLSNLKYLSLWANQLSGNIPNSIGNCSGLEVLSLTKNQLGGMVPMELGKLSLLTTLYLSQNQLVSTSRNTLAFLNDLTNCSHLQLIDLSANYLTGMLPPSIGHLSTNLSHLNLSSNMMSGAIPQQISNLTNLTFLDLGNNFFSGSIPFEIKKLQKLERLYLNGNKLGGGIPMEIGQMQHLGLLNLGQNQLSGKIPDSLCSPQQLRRLHLQHNNLSGEIPATLNGCRNLELLDFSYNKLRGRIPRQLIANLQNLQFFLNLSWNSLQGSLPQEMSKIANAQAIDISGNRLTGVIPNALGDCTQLEHLNLSYNAFEGPIPDSLSKLLNLQEMDLSVNFLSGSIPMSLGRLKVLNYINVSFNNLSGQIADGGLFPNRTVITLFEGNLGLCGPTNYSLPPCPKQTQKKNSLLKKILYSVAGAIALILISFITRMLWKHKFSRQLLHPSKLFLQRLSYPKFPFQDLVVATSGFDESNLLGVGNFGSVYKGILRNGKIVAIKSLNLHNEESQKSFNTECRVLGRIRHRNLIKIISAFYYPSLKGLVLQYASNGSLENHLHPNREDQDLFELGLSECLSIATDVAHGMEYLHHDCPLQIVHCDLKPSNVLLDANMTALVTDFGISRLITTPNSIDSLSTTTFALRGSIGYIAPEYGLGGNISIKGDVYSYGILILEMVTRKRPSDDMFVGDLNLQKWVSSAFPNRVAEIVDSRLLMDVNSNMEENGFLLSFIHVGLLCTNESPRERPSMRDVSMALENLKTSLKGNIVSSNLTSTISDLLRNTNPTTLSASDSQSSTF